MYKLIPLLILLNVAGCTKNPEPTYTPKTYPTFSHPRVTHFGNFRLFTRNGEINNQSLVQQYATEFGAYFYSPTSNWTDPALSKFALVTEDSLWNLGTVPVGEMKRRSIDEYDLFTSPQWAPQNDTNALALHLMKYKVFEKAQTPLGLDYLKVYTPSCVAKKVADTLFFPVNRYIVVSRNQNTTGFSSDRFNNSLDSSGVRKLAATDTLLIRQFDVALMKE